MMTVWRSHHRGGLYNGLTYEEIMSGHSKLRNRVVANIFNQMGLVEAWGTGIRRIREAATSYGLPIPEILVFDDMFRVNLYRSQALEIYGNYSDTSEKHRRSIGEASGKHRRSNRNSIERISMIPREGFWNCYLQTHICHL